MIRHLTLSLLACAAFTTAWAAEEAKPAEAKRAAAAAWCFEHDLPKDHCVACDKKLIPQLKKDGDYCTEHKAAESFCRECDPKAAARIDAIRPVAAEWPKDWKPAGAK